MPVSGLLHSQTKRKSQVSEACRESSHNIQATPASIEFGFSLLRIDERIDDDALVDAQGIAGVKRVYGTQAVRLFSSRSLCRCGGRRVRLPGGTAFFPLVIGELLHMGAVTVHHKYLAIRLRAAGVKGLVLESHS